MAASIGFMVVVLVAAVAGLVAAVRSGQRAKDAAASAQAAGLEYSAVDPFDCDRLAFPLFREGDGRGVERVMWREREDNRSVRAFDYWFYVEDQSESGQVHRRYKHFSCALAQINGSFPELTVEREGVLDRLAATLGYADIDFESEEFNRQFVIRSPDARFATALIDPRMMAFLLSTKGRLSFHLRGRWVLIAGEQVAAHLLPALVKLADAFVDHVPDVVWDLYPTPFLDEDGKQLPAGDDYLALQTLPDARGPVGRARGRTLRGAER